MSADEGIPLLVYALEKEEDDRIFLRWVQAAQTVMSFDAFKESLRPKSKKTDKEVLDDVEHILTSFEERR